LENNHSFDVIIAGAGPAGSTCALALKESGLRVALIDKSKFPRDKVCGDAIGGRVKSVLRKLDPELLSKLEAFPDKNISKAWRLYAPNGKEVEVNFTHPGYVSRRREFDNFIFSRARDSKHVEVFENFYLDEIKRSDGKITVTDKLKTSISAKIVIGCDGAHSEVAKQLAGFSVNHSHYSGAVRAYYENIESFSDPHSIEIHLVKNFLPGYFWVFPLSSTSANVGFGMLSKDIGRRKINLKEALKKIIADTPLLARRFANARLEGEITGFGLPLGGVRRKISGDRFMLCGDAASLIDPLNGEGIGNAMLSAVFAAEQVKRCYHADNFSPGFISQYDQEIYRRLLPELRRKLLLQRIFNREWLINTTVNAAIRFPSLKNRLSKML